MKLFKVQICSKVKIIMVCVLIAHSTNACLDIGCEGAKCEECDHIGEIAHAKAWCEQCQGVDCALGNVDGANCDLLPCRDNKRVMRLCEDSEDCKVLGGICPLPSDPGPICIDPN